MSNYFDNQTKWAWTVSDGQVEVMTDHGTHTHTLDLNKTTIGDMAKNTGQVMGDAHRAASHDVKEKGEQKMNEDAKAFRDSLRVQVDEKAMKMLAEKAQNAEKNRSNTQNKDYGGRELGEEGPGNLGRASEYKGMDSPKEKITGYKTMNFNPPPPPNNGNGNSHATAQKGVGKAVSVGKAVQGGQAVTGGKAVSGGKGHSGGKAVSGGHAATGGNGVGGHGHSGGKGHSGGHGNH